MNDGLLPPGTTQRQLDGPDEEPDDTYEPDRHEYEDEYPDAYEPRDRIE